MQKEIIIAGVLGVLLLVVVAQSLQLNSLNANLASQKTAGLSAAGTGVLDTSTWTANEKMNYEMHGTIPDRAKGSVSASAAAAQSSAPRQVGGC